MLRVSLFFLLFFSSLVVIGLKVHIQGASQSGSVSKEPQEALQGDKASERHKKRVLGENPKRKKRKKKKEKSKGKGRTTGKETNNLIPVLYELRPVDILQSIATGRKDGSQHL